MGKSFMEKNHKTSVKDITDKQYFAKKITNRVNDILYIPEHDKLLLKNAGEQRAKNGQNNPGEESGESMVLLPDMKICYKSN